MNEIDRELDEWQVCLQQASADELKTMRADFEKFVRAQNKTASVTLLSLLDQAHELYVRHRQHFTFGLLAVDQLMVQQQYAVALERIQALPDAHPSLAQMSERKARLHLALNDPLAALLALMPDLLLDAPKALAKPYFREMFMRTLLQLGDAIVPLEQERQLNWYQQMMQLMPDSDAPARYQLRVMKTLARFSDALPVICDMLRQRPDDISLAREFGQVLRLCNRPLVDRILMRARRHYEHQLMTPMRFLSMLYVFERQCDLVDVVDAEPPLLDNAEIAKLYRLSLYQSGQYRRLWLLSNNTGVPSVDGLAADSLAAFERVAQALGLLPADADVSTMTRALVAQFGHISAQYEPIPGRVLVVTHSLGVGGCERQIQYLLASSAHNPPIEFRLLVKQRRARGFSVQNIQAEYFDDMPACESAAMQQAGLWAEDVARVFRVESLAKLIAAIIRLRPQVVHHTVGNVVETMLASLLCGVPGTLVQFGSMHLAKLSNGAQTGALMQEQLDDLGRQLYALNRFTFAVNGVAAVADWTQTWNVEAARFKLISNAFDVGHIGAGIPLPEHERLLAEMDQWRLNGGKVVGSVFRMDDVKDPWFWFATVRRLLQVDPRVMVVHCGDGPAKNWMEKLSLRFGLSQRLRFAGIVTDALLRFYQRFDVFLLTSHTECLPNVVLEAQSTGVPVVAPDTGGIYEGIVAGKATLMASKNTDDYVRALEQWLALESVDQAAETARMRRDILQRYTIDTMIAQTLSAYFPGAGQVHND